MHLRRVAVTGMGAVSPFGKGVDVLMDSLFKGESGTVRVPELESIKGVRSHVAALVKGVAPGVVPRKHRRTMTRMSVFALLACQEALAQANLPPECITGGDMGLSVGSTIASIDTLQKFFEGYLAEKNIDRKSVV